MVGPFRKKGTAMSQTTPTNVQRGEPHGVPALEHTRRTYSPPVDIYETENELVLHADMPGVNAQNLDIRFEDGELTILGKVADRQPEDQKYLLHEYGVGDFYRVFAISEAVDVSRIAAECSNGVLTLHLPKTEAVKPRRIAVKGG